jgi:hypothetical protein
MIPEDKVVAYLGIDPDDLDAVQVAVDYVDRLLTWVENQTGRHFREPKLHTERLSGDDTTALWIREMPVFLDGDYEEEPDLLVEKKEQQVWSEVEGADYDLIDFRPIGPHLLEHATRWKKGRRNYRITYMAGYESGELPGDIEQLVLEMAGHKYRERGKEGLRSETIGGYSYSRADGGGEAQHWDGWNRIIQAWRHTVFA